MFAKSPGLMAVLTGTLALGIGANTAVFSIIEGVLLRPLPYHDPGRLIDILDTSLHEKQLARIFASYDDFLEFSKHATMLESLAATTWAGRTGAILSGHGPSKSYLTVPVTENFFGTLGVGAALGRTFTSDDRARGCSVVLSNAFWRGPLHADPAIVGQSVSLDDRACTVDGVMPAGFVFYPPETQIWKLLAPDDPRLKDYFGVFMVARLKRGAAVSQASSELTTLHSALHTGDVNGEREFAPLVGGLQDQFTWLAGRNLRATLAVLFAAVVLVLVIACGNVANLLLARSLARGREFAIRAALGSGVVRLARQLLIEAALVSIAGGALGVLLAYAAIRAFAAAPPVELPVGTRISLNLPVIAFTATISILTTIVFGIAPLWSISRGDVNHGLRATGPGAGPGRQRLARLLVAAEMALSVLLLAGAGLLMRSVAGFESTPLGFARDRIVIASGTLPGDRYADPAHRLAFYDQLNQKLGRLPGVGAAAIASLLPPYDPGLGTVEVQGRPVDREARPHDVGQVTVGPDYFRALDVPILRGRAIDARDRPQSDPVVVVNEAFAREYFPDRNPIGGQIRLEDKGGWLTIAGVSGNELRPQVFNEMAWLQRPAVYRALAQDPPLYFAIAVGGVDRQSGFAHTLDATVASIDSNVATGDLESMRSRLEPYLKYPRFRAVIIGGFAGLAMLLAAVGLYGVLAQFVTVRTREIGVRMAVGAGRGDIARWIARIGGAPVVGGLMVGFAASLGMGRFLSAFLYGVAPGDPETFVAVIVVLTVAASLAMVLPARRASRVDPMIALRGD